MNYKEDWDKMFAIQLKENTIASRICKTGPYKEPTRSQVLKGKIMHPIYVIKDFIRYIKEYEY